MAQNLLRQKINMDGVKFPECQEVDTSGTDDDHDFRYFLDPNWNNLPMTRGSRTITICSRTIRFAMPYSYPWYV